MFSVPPELFGEALVRIQTVDFYISIISEAQVLSLFRNIASSDEMKLRELDISRVPLPHLSRYHLGSHSEAGNTDRNTM